MCLSHQQPDLSSETTTVLLFITEDELCLLSSHHPTSSSKSPRTWASHSGTAGVDRLNGFY